MPTSQQTNPTNDIYISPYLHEDHGGDLLGGEGLGLVKVLNLDNGVATLVDDLERPGLNILLDDGVLEAATDQTPVPFESERICNCGECANLELMGWARNFFPTHLISKTVLAGFMAAWFLAASPIRRSLSVKETKEGVV